MALLVSWFWAAALTCAPVLGLGLYHDPELGCVRYRNAVTTTDFIYAAFYVTFGEFLTLLIEDLRVSLKLSLNHVGLLGADAKRTLPSVSLVSTCAGK